MLKKVISGTVAATFLMNVNVLTINALISAITPVFAAEPTETETPLLDKLREKYKLDDPYRNHNSEAAIKAAVERSSTNRPSQVMQQSILNPRPTQSLNIPTLSGDEQQALQARSWELAAPAANTHAAPSMTPDGNLSAKYSNKGTREFYRDKETGELKFKIIDDVDSIEYREGGVSRTEIASQELENEGVEFEADEAYGDEQRYFQEGKKTHENLTDTGTRTGEAFAYRALTSTANQALNTEINENILTSGFNYLHQANQEGGDFWGACKETTSTVKQEIEIVTKTTEYCHQNNSENMLFCEIERIHREPVKIEGAKVKSCGDGCFAVVIGSETEEHKAESHCWLFEDNAKFSMVVAGDMTLASVKLVGNINDHTKVLLNNTPVFSLIWGQEGVDDPLPPTGDGVDWCEMGYDRIPFEKDITDRFMADFNANKIPSPAGDQYEVQVDMKNAIRHWGGWYMEVQLQFVDESGLGFGSYIKDNPKGCYDRVGEPGETITPEQGEGMPLTSFEMACTFDGYSPIEVGTRGYPAWMLTEFEPLYEGDEEEWTWRANLDGYRCNPLGDGYYCPGGNDTSSEDQCWSYEDLMENSNTCQAFEEDAACYKKDELCADGMYDEVYNVCWMKSVRYECEDSTTFTRNEEVTENACESMLPCVDGNCVDLEEETTNDFTKAVGMASMLEDMGGEESCFKDDPDNCEIFKGEVRECRYDITGLIPNCCEDAAGTSLFQYIMFAKQSLRIEEMMYGGEFGSTVQGAWAPIRDGITTAWDSLPFTSPSESIEGASSLAASTNEWIADKMMTAIYEYMPPSWASVFVTEVPATEKGGDSTLQWSEEFSDFADYWQDIFGTIMFYYQMYNYIKIALGILYACPDDELDMGPLIAGGQCFEYKPRTSKVTIIPPTIWYTEHHCCYSSTLARIVMEQAHPLLGIPLDQCAGLTQSRLDELDWDQIDFSEWLDLMYASDLMREESLEGLTGSGRTLNNMTSEDVVEECPAGYSQVDDNTCMKTVSPNLGGCSATTSWQQIDDTIGDIVNCETQLEKSSDTTCFYYPGSGVYVTETGSIPYSCPAVQVAKENFGCPEEFYYEGGQCIHKVKLNFGGRQNAVDRTQERFDFDLDGTKRDREDSAKDPIDCSTYPRPEVCEFGFTPTGGL